MNILELARLSPTERKALTRRPCADNVDLSTTVSALCTRVKVEGDEAVARLTEEFDHQVIPTTRVEPFHITAAASSCRPDLLEAIRRAIRNVRAFHERQAIRSERVETEPGIHCWREYRPIASVGLYVPAGSAPLPSTLIMLAVPAHLAGCERIVVCSPPRGGTVDPAILTVAHELGLPDVFAVGGVQAIAAMAYGTQSIPRVEKIFGPGNAYVTAAKRFVSTDHDGAAIDLPAGPSELLVLSDATADPRFVAADLLSQAEHDPCSQVLLVSTDATFAREVVRIVERSIPALERAPIIRESISRSFALVVATMDEAVAFTNAYAPEHLSLQTAQPEELISRIRNAGSVFVGPWSPVTAGDYASGTNHTLPTGGDAAIYGGLTVESFCKSMTVQRLTHEGLRSLRPTLTALSTCEGLTAHREAVEARFR